VIEQTDQFQKLLKLGTKIHIKKSKKSDLNQKILSYFLNDDFSNPVS